MTTSIDPRYLTVDGVAAYLSKSPKAIRHLVVKAQIPHARIGRSVRFDRVRIDAWMQEQVDRRRPQ